MPDLPPGVTPARVRTFVRRGRLSSLTRDRVERLAPARSCPTGPSTPLPRSAASPPSCSRSAAATATPPSRMPPRSPSATSSPWTCTPRGSPGCSPTPTRPACRTCGSRRATPCLPRGAGRRPHVRRGPPLLPRPVAQDRSTRNGASSAPPTSTCSPAAQARRPRPHRHGPGLLRRARPRGGRGAPAVRGVPRRRPRGAPRDGFRGQGNRAGRTISELRLDLLP